MHFSHCLVGIMPLSVGVLFGLQVCLEDRFEDQHRRHLDHSVFDGRYPQRSLALVSDLSLGVFLTMSLMSLQLWTIIDLAGPLLAMLGAQFVIAFLFTLTVVFRVMGRDYESAVICSGFSGFALGATPTAMANMTAVTKKYGQAHRAFIIVPLVSGFFVDICNALIITKFLGWVG